MIYSVWNQKKRAFDYYDDGVVGPTHAPPTRVGATTQLGTTPEDAAWPLPAGARLVGSGRIARGRVATLGGLETTRDTLVVGAALAGAFLLARRYLR